MKTYLCSIGLTVILFLQSCTSRHTPEYYQYYSHLSDFQVPASSMQEEDYFLVILVDACRLDYTDTQKFFQSIASRRQNGEVGHAWIYLQGKQKDGTVFGLEGGHSGERFDYPARYFEGVMNYNLWGYANPTPEQKKNSRYEPNPVKYMLTVREDGFFQKGAGGHRPTCAVKISLTCKQFEQILFFIKPSNYPYREYGLAGPQCCTFVRKVAALVGLNLDAEMTMPVAPWIVFCREQVRLWEDPKYSMITFETPDVLEKSLMQAVRSGRVEYALDWYLCEKR